VVQEEKEIELSIRSGASGNEDRDSSPGNKHDFSSDNEHKSGFHATSVPLDSEARRPQYTTKELMAQGEERLHAKLRTKKGPLGWAMRLLHNNPLGPGQVYEFHNMTIIAKRIPAMVVVGLMYGAHYDIHAAQTGIEGTPEGERMKRVYAAAEKYPNEVEHSYSFVQVCAGYISISVTS